MADWKWFAGEPKGRCPQCHEPLRRSDILVEYETLAYHVHCLLDVLSAAVRATRYGQHYSG